VISLSDAGLLQLPDHRVVRVVLVVLVVHVGQKAGLRLAQNWTGSAWIGSDLGIACQANKLRAPQSQSGAVHLITAINKSTTKSITYSN